MAARALFTSLCSLGLIFALAPAQVQARPLVDLRIAVGKRPPPPPPRVPVRVRRKQHRPAPPKHCGGPDQVWVSGHPGKGGIWIAGHCERVGPAPRAGWIYVSGYWRAGVWVQGFWRPSTRVGFAWVEPRVNNEEEWEPGYWEPDGEAPEGMIWRPGYWDGNEWSEGGWVPSESYTTYDENGEIEFFAVGDGHVEELAIPASGSDEGVTLVEDAAGDEPKEALEAADTGTGPSERHAAVPE